MGIEKGPGSELGPVGPRRSPSAPPAVKLPRGGDDQWGEPNRSNLSPRTPMPSTSPARELDPVTESVRAFYEQYPYPSCGAPMLRTGFDARLVAGHAQECRPAGKPLSILDAGCGRGVGLLTTATLHPSARVVGVDLCRAALEDCRAQVRARGLANVELVEADLLTLDGVSVPEGGFDVIHSSGVLHHLSDPAAGLARLVDVMAPTGVMVMMLYGTVGRRGIRRVQRALAAWIDPDAPLAERLASSRLLVEEFATEDEDCPWRAAAGSPDAEFVDRYLHPNECDYEVPELFDLVEKAGLRFLRWTHPEHWSLDGVMPEGPLRDTVEALPERERFTMIEQVARPENLQLFLCKAGNGPRRLPPPSDWADQLFATHPEVCFEVGHRSLWKQPRLESLHYRLRGGEPVLLPPGPLQRAAHILASQCEPFRGSTLMGALAEDGVPEGQLLPTLVELVERELVYLPHEVELE